MRTNTFFIVLLNFSTLLPHWNVFKFAKRCFKQIEVYVIRFQLIESSDVK